MRNAKPQHNLRTTTKPHDAADARWNAAPQEIGHRGHGPKSYTRSDERIYEDVCEMLTRHDAIDARDIEVIVTQGDVTLRGTVATRQMKDTALHAIEEVVGVKSTYDDLRVKKEEGHA